MAAVRDAKRRAARETVRAFLKDVFSVLGRRAVAIVVIGVSPVQCGLLNRLAVGG